MKLLLTIALSACFMSCAHSIYSKRPNLTSITVGDSIQSDLGWLKGIQNWHINSPAKPYSIQVDPTLSYQGEPTLRFELRPGDSWVGPSGSTTYRAELVPGHYPAKESVRFYSCNIFIPKGFPSDENRLVVMQWWPQTKTELGEKGRSPSLALRYTEGKYSVTIRHSDLHVVTEPDAVPKKTVFTSKKIEQGKWNQFTFETKWSFKSDGYVKVWLNQKQVADYQGPVGYDDERGPIFKFGMYRDDNHKTYVSYFNQCREGDSLESVQR